MKKSTQKTKKVNIDINNIDPNELPVFLFHQGTNYRAFDFLGAHFYNKNDKNGVIFRTWAPNASSVSIVGDFNCWNDKANPMVKISNGGIYEGFVEGLTQYDNYKFAVKRKGKTVFKADPYAFHSETPSKNASKVYDIDGYEWGDAEYMSKKEDVYSKPMNIYEVNLASWKKKSNGDYYSYRELADELINYVLDMGYTHIELMPLTEYPFDGSWGYQVTGYYSITSRFGTPKDFMYFIDCCHQKGISVIMDWVPAHFPKDEFGLYEFDGTCCYENKQWDRKEHKTWGTRIFDWGRNEVQSFLISNALFFFEKFHIDGLRVDAVSSMLYLDYDREDGEWQPNEYGGNYNLQAIAFLQKLNKEVFARFPKAMMIAEESTSYPMITKPVDMGGLGFNYKWNMGWMNDSLAYMKCDPYFRSSIHDKLTFSMCYAFSENYVLPISHDEVVHGKRSLLDKMPGDIPTKFANYRAFLTYMFAHPGKKLSFMGNEYGQFREWDYENGLEFFMLDFELHKKLWKFNKYINNVYKNNAPLFEIDHSWEGFEWISTEEKDNNVISFIRKDKKGNILVALINFSGNDYFNYRLGVPKGEYKIILSSDDARFGGCGLIKRKTLKSAKKQAHGKENSVLINVPKFSGIYLLKK